MAAYGRRPLIIFTALLTAAASIWKAKSRSYGSFMGASALHGFAAGPSEVSLGPGFRYTVD